MNYNFLRNVAIYTAGIVTVIFLNEVFHFFDSKEVTLYSSSLDSSDSSTYSAAMLEPLAVPCACDTTGRYEEKPEPSGNYSINEATCRTLVADGSASGSGVPKGAWFSKVAIDNMFCRFSTANGIYVYHAYDKATKAVVYVAEPAHTNYTRIDDDGVSYIYGTRSLCPMICGVCGE